MSTFDYQLAYVIHRNHRGLSSAQEHHRLGIGQQAVVTVLK